MGLDPNDDSYIPTDACPACTIPLFGGETPKHVLAIFTGILPCPLAPGDPPNGSYLLEQNPANRCQWFKITPTTLVLWDIAPNGSLIALSSPAGNWFNGTSIFNCIDRFHNNNTCVFELIGIGGIAIVWWGPQIGKEPCS